LNEIPDAMFRETVRDFMVNQQFRKDYWVRGARRLNLFEQNESLRKYRLMLVQPRADVSLKVKGSLGEASMQESVYAPILDVLADHQPRTIGQIEQAVKSKGIVLSQIREAALVLTAAGSLQTVQDDEIIVKAKKQVDRLNLYLCNKARSGNDNTYLASPVTGGGVTVGRFPQLFLLALASGKQQPSELVDFVWEILVAQGQKIVRDGKICETEQENLTELLSQVTHFLEKQKIILMALQIV
jgi:hypothetical protein